VKAEYNEQLLLKGLVNNDSRAIETIYKENFNIILALITNNNGNITIEPVERDLYEGGIRVPFIAYWPGKIKSSVIDKPAALWDMYPTFLNAAGIAVKKNLDGISLLPIFTGKGKQKQNEFFNWRFH